MLERYGERRDFTRTPEPPPGKPSGDGKALRFVIQKHAARRLHYDFRIESDGVLKSWAVPAGPSLDPSVKHLAVMVEDHPLDYGSFEGVIPEGQYGAGQVIVWDNGTYSPDPEEYGVDRVSDRDEAQAIVRAGLEKGKLSLYLNGNKLNGSFALVRMKPRTGKDKDNWLLIKHRDEFATGEPVLEKEESVQSGLTIEDLKEGRTASQPPSKSERMDRETITDEMPTGAREAPFPSKVLPMLATLTRAPFSDPAFIFEPKLDGFRMIALVKDGKARMQSRNGIDATDRFRGIVLQLGRLPVKQAVFDGEVIAFGKDKRPCFQCMQQHFKPGATHADHEEPIAIVYYIFDILYADGYDLTQVMLSERKKLLERIVQPEGPVQRVAWFDRRGEETFRASVEQGFEGVVAKRKDSRYQPGRRSTDWLKVKTGQSDDFVIAGYSAGQGARDHTFGALLLGQYDDRDRLVYTGHVGTGFNDRLLRELTDRLDSIRASHMPFEEKPQLHGPTTWVRPELVAEVKYSERTHEGILRAPVFVRLRDDKPPSEARLARIVPTPSGSESSKDAQKAVPHSSLRRSKSRPVPEPVEGPVEGPKDKRPARAREPYREVLDQLETPGDRITLEIDGDRLLLTNLDKPIWPSHESRPACTKRDLLRYFARVAPYLLPHLKDRPLTLTRYPNGIYGEKFYQKHYETSSPSFITRVPIHSEHVGKVEDYIVCNNLGTLLWLGQLADLEIHSWFSRTVPGPDGPDRSLLKSDAYGLADAIADYPDFIIFDLDPYIYSGAEKKGAEPELNRQAFARTCEAALWLKGLLDGLSLKAFVKTSGRTGIHIYVPILRQLEYKAVRATAETIGRHLLAMHPNEITMEWTVAKRTGKIFVDHNRNARGQTLASIYSPRPSPEASVSIPLRWDEVGKVYPTEFTMDTVPPRLKKVGDLWSGILDAKSDLKSILST